MPDFGSSPACTETLTACNASLWILPTATLHNKTMVLQTTSWPVETTMRPVLLVSLSNSIRGAMRNQKTALLDTLKSTCRRHGITVVVVGTGGATMLESTNFLSPATPGGALAHSGARKANDSLVSVTGLRPRARVVGSATAVNRHRHDDNHGGGLCRDGRSQKRATHWHGYMMIAIRAKQHLRSPLPTTRR